MNTNIKQFITSEVVRLIPTSSLDWGGRSAGDKINYLIDFILNNKPNYLVEIGVFRGAFSLAAASTMKYIGHGHITGVDPYKIENALEPESLPELENQIAALPFDEIYQTLVSTIKNNQLSAFIDIHRMASRESALTYDKNISLLHIDGNHDSIYVAEDVSLWVPKVISGGIIIMDDTNWPSVRKGLADLVNMAELIVDGGTYQIWKKF